MEQPLICNFKNYFISGTALIETWDGTIGIMTMNSTHTDEDMNNHKKCLDFINDGGFGAKDILAAYMVVSKSYEHGASKVFYDEIFNLADPNKEVSEEDRNKLVNCYLGLDY